MYKEKQDLRGWPLKHNVQLPDIPDDANNPLTEAGRVLPLFQGLSDTLLWPVVDARRQELLRSMRALKKAFRTRGEFSQDCSLYPSESTAHSTSLSVGSHSLG